MIGDGGFSVDSDVSYEVGTEEFHSHAVVRAVATVTNTPVDELAPLYDQIDTDALDALFDRPGRPDDGEGVVVTFPFGGCRVSVTQRAVHVSDRGNAD